MGQERGGECGRERGVECGAREKGVECGARERKRGECEVMLGERGARGGVWGERRIWR